MWFCHVICSQERGKVKNPSATRRAQMWTFPQTWCACPHPQSTIPFAVPNSPFLQQETPVVWPGHWGSRRHLKGRLGEGGHMTFKT